MGKPLEIAAAELSLKDKVSRGLKKIDKGMAKSTKLLSKTEKQTKKNEKENIKLAKSLDKVSRAQKKIKPAAAGGPSFRQRVGAGARRGAGAVKGGLSAFTGGIGGVPIVGGVIASILGSIAATRQTFVAGISLEKELKTLANDYRKAFGKRAASILTDVRKDRFFRTEDAQAAFAGLAGAGVRPQQVAKQQKVLMQFTKAQGLTSLTEGIQRLTSGSIKAGKGLSAIDIKQLQALGPLMKDVSTAPIAFDQIVNILKKANLSKAAQDTDKALRGVVRSSNLIQDMQQQTVRQGAAFKGATDAFIVSEKSLQLVNKNVANLARVTAPGVAASIKGVSKLIDKPGSTVKNLLFAPKKAAMRSRAGRAPVGKADGGRINGPEIVGERGPELFTPSQSGSILPNERLKKLVGATRGRPQVQQITKQPVINFNPTINVNAGNAEQAVSIGRQIREELAAIVNNMRFETGLSIG
jgi:hypothetical protein